MAPHSRDAGSTIKKELAYASENILQIIKYEIYRQEIVELGIHLVADPRWAEEDKEKERESQWNSCPSRGG